MTFFQPEKKALASIAFANGARGFTLVEMALVLVILGLFVGSVVSGIKVNDDARDMRVTKERQNRIAMALSDHALKYGRLPCAADATDAPDDFGREKCPVSGDNIGPVPYRTLGLTLTDIYDGYGNLMTYEVYEAAWNAPAATQINGRCRFSAISYSTHTLAGRNHWHVQHYTPPWMVWIDTVGDVTVGGTNRNPHKARFCCQRVPDYDKIYNSAGVLQRAADPIPYSSAAMYWGDINIANVGGGAAINLNAYMGQRITYDAYMLTSHGKNGSGAYIYQGGGSFTRVPSLPSSTASVYDTATSAPDNRRLMPYNLNPGPDYYDNIVLWRTQETTVSESGLTECVIP